MTNQALSPDSNSQTFEYKDLGITINARLNTDLDQLTPDFDDNYGFYIGASRASASQAVRRNGSRS